MRAQFMVIFSQESVVKRSRKPAVNSFQVALDAAGKCLDKALSERTSALAKLTELNAEIPKLQQTIQALQAQLNPNSVTFRNSATGQETAASGEVVVPAIPAELLKLVGPQDLTGMSSSFPKAKDEDLLPDAEGIPLVEE